MDNSINSNNNSNNHNFNNNHNISNSSAIVNNAVQDAMLKMNENNLVSKRKHVNLKIPSGSKEYLSK